MPRSFTAAQQYSQDISDVFAAMCDTQYLEFLLTNSGGVDPEVEALDLSDDRWRITLDRALPAQVPSFLRAMVGDHITVREQREWGAAADDGSRTGVLTVTFDGAPARIDGTLALTPGDSGTCGLTVEGEVKASIPLVGGKVEEFARDQLLRFVAREEELAQHWADGERSAP